ncbi:MAG TPA: glycosyltransferase [Candidatus Baltobacteraceae bacterium]|nr:glycosyltransferase [Candidatus Baltobacteraceae bacterium]
MPSFDVIVAALHLRWDGVWQRPNHLLSRLSRDVPVIVVEEPVPGERDGERIERTGNVTVVRPVRASWTDTIDERTCEAVRRLLGGRRPLLWFYTPQMLPLADAFPAAPVVYDKMDELARFKDADPRIAQREPQLLERAAVAFAGGRTLFASIADRVRAGGCYPSGVEVAHFARARRPRPRDAAQRDARLTYVGVIDERLDLDLIARAAALRPGWTFEMNGPVAKIDPQTLPRAQNIVYPGKRAYEELPRVLAAADVAVMPFALNEATRSISPTKTLEYLAAGVPVVSTRVADVVADYAGIVRFASDAEEFVREAELALQPDGARESRAAERVSVADWDTIAAAMRDELAANGVAAASGARDGARGTTLQVAPAR